MSEGGFFGRGFSKSKYMEVEKYRRYFRSSIVCMYRDIFFLVFILVFGVFVFI